MPVDKSQTPAGAIDAGTCQIPGYFWWLPACADSTEPSEWTIVCFHPQGGKAYSGWFVGPLLSPRVADPAKIPSDLVRSFYADDPSDDEFGKRQSAVELLRRLALDVADLSRELRSLYETNNGRFGKPQAVPEDSQLRRLSDIFHMLDCLFGKDRGLTPWQPMATAPKNATWVEVLLPDHTVVNAHWAEDMSGEEQPPFRGWFASSASLTSFREVPAPIAWRPLA